MEKLPHPSHCYRNSLYIGQIVDIVQKHHQPTGELTRGVITEFLTPGVYHPRGLKVKIQTNTADGIVGRVVNAYSHA